MLVETNVLFMDELGDLTLSKVKENCYAYFAANLKHELLSKSQMENTMGLFNYDEFVKTYGKKIQYNNKNITYTETFYDLKDYCGRFYNLQQEYELVNVGLEYKPSDGKAYKKWVCPNREEYEEKVKKAFNQKGICTDVNEYAEMQVCSHFTDYFGKGEFPFMTITLLRLGNQDYYFAQIVR